MCSVVINSIGIQNRTANTGTQRDDGTIAGTTAAVPGSFDLKSFLARTKYVWKARHDGAARVLPCTQAHESTAVHITILHMYRTTKTLYLSYDLRHVGCAGCVDCRLRTAVVPCCCYSRALVSSPLDRTSHSGGQILISPRFERHEYMKTHLVARAPDVPERGHHNTTTPRESRVDTSGQPHTLVVRSSTPRVAHYKSTHTGYAAPGLDSPVQSLQSLSSLESQVSGQHSNVPPPPTEPNHTGIKPPAHRSGRS